ncbi:hypothetical protein Ancab_021624 [Ancistrocladus abbreviatus]
MRPVGTQTAARSTTFQTNTKPTMTFTPLRANTTQHNTTARKFTIITDQQTTPSCRGTTVADRLDFLAQKQENIFLITFLSTWPRLGTKRGAVVLPQQAVGGAISGGAGLRRFTFLGDDVSLLSSPPGDNMQWVGCKSLHVNTGWVGEVLIVLQRRKGEN